MKISRFTNTNITNYNFCAGHTKLYTDFDGTYFPFSQNLLENNDPPTCNAINTMYRLFDDFKKIAKDKFSSIITTGRSRIEMKRMLYDFKSAKTNFSSPDEYIFRDGLEKTTLDENGRPDLDSSSHFLYDTAGITGIIKTIDSDINIIYSSTNKSIQNDPNNSLEAQFKKLPINKRRKYVSVVSEDNGMVELIFSPNIDSSLFLDKIKEHFQNQQVSINHYTNDRNFYIPVQKDKQDEKYAFEPAHVIMIKPMQKGKIVDKLNDPKDSVKDVIRNKSNNLVIVAGDGSNDINMLNPFNYLDLYGINIDKTKTPEELISDPIIAKAIEKLPLMVVVAGQKDDLNSILKIKDLLEEKHIYKIFVAKNPSKDLLEKIKQGMLVYSDNNDEYKYNLGFGLYKELLG